MKTALLIFLVLTLSYQVEANNGVFGIRTTIFNLFQSVYHTIVPSSQNETSTPSPIESATLPPYILDELERVEPEIIEPVTEAPVETEVAEPAGEFFLWSVLNSIISGPYYLIQALWSSLNGLWSILSNIESVPYYLVDGLWQLLTLIPKYLIELVNVLIYPFTLLDE